MKVILVTREKDTGNWQVFTSSSSRSAPDLGAAVRRVLALLTKGYTCLWFTDPLAVRQWSRIEDPRYEADHKKLLRYISDNEVQTDCAPWVRGTRVKQRLLKPTKADESRLVIYTDGSCLGNPGFGGWAFSFRKRVFSGGALKVTNNQMELQAVIRALKHAAAKAPGKAIRICSDSQYVVNGCTQFRHAWARRGFEGIANSELWKRADKLLRAADVQVVWVKAHAGHGPNEEVDAAARKAAYAQKDQG